MNYVIEKKNGCLLVMSADSAPETLIVTACGGEIEAMLPDITKAAGDCRPFALLAPLDVDWDSDYTPWPSDELPGRKMSGGAPDFHRRITDRLLPDCLNGLPSVTRTAVLGYSLGGLFAVWAALQPDSPFDSAATVSGALWYEGIVDYVRGTRADRLKRVYLSLGRREAKAGRGAMGRVAEATQSLTALFEDRLGVENTRFEWNNGNHFFEVPQRIARAVAWIARRD